MPTNGTKKVLLVAPGAAQVQTLGQHLNKRGIQVITAGNGASGLLAAHAEKPALIIVEAELPVMDGYQMLEALRRDPATRHMSVIMLTPDAAGAEVARGWLCGADFCLPKDCGLSDLMLTVERTLRTDGAPEFSLAS
jgi:DNA-binding response OmpR family regulator